MAKLLRPSPNPSQVQMFTFSFASPSPSRSLHSSPCLSAAACALRCKFVSYLVFDFLACMFHFQQRICRVDFHYEIFIKYFTRTASRLLVSVRECVFAAHQNNSSCFCLANAVTLVYVFLLRGYK